MEMEQVKTWLSRAREAAAELEALEQSKMNLYLRAVSMTQRYDGDAVSGSRDPHGKMDAYAAYADMVDREATELSTLSTEIMRVIRQVPDGTQRAILMRRYLSFKKWEQIAEAMGYTYRNVIRLHGKALLSVKAVLERMEPPPLDNKERKDCYVREHQTRD